MLQVFLWIHRLSAIAIVVFTNEFFFLIFRNNSCGENYHNKISTIHLKKETVRCNYFNCFYSIRACYIITMKLFLNQTENFLHLFFLTENDIQVSPPNVTGETRIVMFLSFSGSIATPPSGTLQWIWFSFATTIRPNGLFSWTSIPLNFTPCQQKIIGKLLPKNNYGLEVMFYLLKQIGW